jgi:predicted P-loop ATPase/GTPase
LKIKSLRIRQFYHNIIEFTNSVYYIPVSIEKNDRLTMVENVILSLSKNGYKYQEIADLIDRSKRAIDNTLLRIRKKDEVYNLGLFSKR